MQNYNADKSLVALRSSDGQSTGGLGEHLILQVCTTTN